MHAAALRDEFPVSDGHTLILPRRHVQSVFELVAEVRDRLRLSLNLPPDAFNVGPNDGLAKQTVMHAHVHFIPRYKGDMPDSRGGIRWVLPRKANYCKPEEADPFQQVEFLGFSSHSLSMVSLFRRINSRFFRRLRIFRWRMILRLMGHLEITFLPSLRSSLPTTGPKLHCFIWQPESRH
jgi:diadenosine tetraphosphate (Ap4A) HIT family hydrolase